VTPRVLLAVGLAALGCRREDREFRPAPPFTSAARYEEQYERSAYALSEGKRLYAAFNCQGCHADGGGAIGPPLTDEKWLYGFEPDEVFDTIARGRENGMPAFGGEARAPGIMVVGTVSAHQLWQLTAYVRSLSGLGSADAAPGRNDHMQTKPPENETPPEKPVVVPPPPDVVRPPG